MNQYEEIIYKGAAKQGLDLDDHQLSMLMQVIDLLNKWNKKHNLTRITDTEQQCIHHILDALSAHTFFLPYMRILEIGTGAGFPGIPLAIIYPDKQFHLVDSNGKKIAYLKHLVKQLELKNVSLYHLSLIHI